MPSKGSTTQRGYGYRHRQLRKQYEPMVRAGRATCWRCEQPIAPDAAWDLGHSTDRTHHMGPEHIGKECPAGGNRATHGRERPTRNQQPQPSSDNSRNW